MDIKSFAVLLILVQTGRAQNPSCSNNDTVQQFQAVMKRNPNYPSKDFGEYRCRWIVTCTKGYRCDLSCPEVDLPESPNCRDGSLTVSLTGNPRLVDGIKHCGTRQVNLLSFGNKISVEYITHSNTNGGRFRCRVTAAQYVNTTSDICSCGEKRQERQARIIGGQETGVNEYPMMAEVVDSSTLDILCGAVIISNRHVLTAASCLYGKIRFDIKVTVGDHDLSSGNETTAVSTHDVDEISIHPNYSNATSENSDYDAAVLTLLTRDLITFTDRVNRVCLPFKYVNKNFARSRLTMLGWGSRSPGGPRSDTLQKVNVQVISQAKCRESIRNVTNSQICTYSSGKDACQIDLGGPALYTDPNSGLLYSVGIISNGRPCATTKPRISTRVTDILDWILITTRTPYCDK